MHWAGNSIVGEYHVAVDTINRSMQVLQVRGHGAQNLAGRFWKARGPTATYRQHRCGLIKQLPAVVFFVCSKCALA